MKKKDLSTLRQMKNMELVKAISETKDKLAKMRIDRYSKQSKNVREPRALRQKIAVANTLLHEKELTHE